ncbi:hypothetical protein GQ43DRAFT_441000 [Delitschia confertaspora ATCC 74209]|uniref:Uncharacterized protein n=1 Tax=Delitschia confertaspora ATCC 74209 TaxID=1513339 RepID=A0A9P4JMI8_9PLEO|nr:hypothetical protein GQ43DRAFT_441000 [Delitschia confertaspora ATCC 74209]
MSLSGALYNLIMQLFATWSLALYSQRWPCGYPCFNALSICRLVSHCLITLIIEFMTFIFSAFPMTINVSGSETSSVLLA